MKHLRLIVPVLAVLLTALPVKSGPDRCYGHSMPEFKQVFIKVFHFMSAEMSMDQLKATADKLTPGEKASIGNFLGDDGREAVKQGLSEDKAAFLDEQYKTSGDGGLDFRKSYPHILAVGNNGLTLEQYKRVVGSLSGEDIASQSFFMGDAGREAFFKEMDLAHAEILLSQTPDWVFLEIGMRKYEKIHSYTSILYKQERIAGEVQATEKILLKFREKPHSIYMKWISGPWEGRELVYNEALLGKGKVRVRESGVLGVIAVTLPSDSEIAKRGSNHEVTEIGLKVLLDIIDENYRKGVKNNELSRKNHGITELDGHKVFQMESILPTDQSKGYYCHRMHHYIDFRRSLEIKAVVYDWDNQFYESYYYTEIKVNPGLADMDFDPANPEYNL